MTAAPTADVEMADLHVWSRGHGWPLLGLLDVLEWLPTGHAAAELGRSVAS